MRSVHRPAVGDVGGHRLARQLGQLVRGTGGEEELVPAAASSRAVAAPMPVLAPVIQILSGLLERPGKDELDVADRPRSEQRLAGPR